jgi:DNA-directed RNA polymerase I subunit RPA2
MSKKNNLFLAIERLQSLIKIHIDSFNFSFNQGIFFLNFYLFCFLKKLKLKNSLFFFNFFGLYISTPNFFLKKKKINKIPRQCREFKIDYAGDFLLGLNFYIEKKKIGFILKIGEIPIMIKSNKCNLFYQKKNQFIELDEEEIELGGYFILNGLEKMIRLLIVPKKNFPFAYSRLSNVQRGIFCTSLSCSFRSVDKLCSSKTLHLHYLTNGSIHARIIIHKREFFFPIIILIKALIEITDQKIFEILIKNNFKDKFLRDRIIAMIKDAHEKCNLNNRFKILDFLGKILKIAILIDSSNNIEIAEIFLSRYLFIHLGENRKSKTELLFFMIRKIIMTQKNFCLEDNPDSINSQEFLLPGHLCLIYFKEKIENVITNFFNYFGNTSTIFKKKNIKKNKKDFFKKIFGKIFGKISQGLTRIISTGSIILYSDQEITQTTGLTIFIERINFGRFLSYFRAVHRGKFFFELKNTSGRKLLSHSWGFICPVHTPDGALCGILNHVTISVIVNQTNPIESQNLYRYFLRNFKKYFSCPKTKVLNTIILDGKVIGYFADIILKYFIDKLRAEKISCIGKLPSGCELLLISRFHSKNFFPSFWILSTDSRLLRPVLWHDKTKKLKKFVKKNFLDFKKIDFNIEIIGTIEQNFLNIENVEYQNEFLEKKFKTIHSEIELSIILSIIAGATPFSDMNQSPRNIYQCQMSKQSIGTPFYTFWRRNDTKSYFLISPQISICRNKIIQDGLEIDIFPNSFNSIVSVVTYTGFDMEDAMVINRASIQRGFLMANVYNSFDFNIEKKRKKADKKNFLDDFHKKNFLKIGKMLKQNDPLTPCELDKEINKDTQAFFCYKGTEKAIIEQIKIYSKNNKKKNSEKNILKIRMRRRPNIGDKFASRHGQKGVFSYEYESENLPFSEIGISPEIIFNPHGFPSRMTIGVILESIIGKIGALNGIFQDSTPFRYGQNRPAIYHFGEKLRKNGFQFFGNELLYSGYSGEPFAIDIFSGVVNYQRLRHMVLDKFQVSDYGPRNSLTRQPIKGRKLGGSIRFGEMERDALLGQGCAFLLHDRLQISSDLHFFSIATKTGNLANLKYEISKKFNSKKQKAQNFEYHKKILLPYVLKFLISELSSINIKTSIFTT